ncbi:unnamed protein product [Mortierella alpina]
MPVHQLAHRPTRSRPRHAHNTAYIRSSQASAAGAFSGPSRPFLLAPLSFNTSFPRSAHARAMTLISSINVKATTPSNCRSSRNRKRTYSALKGSLGFLVVLPFLTLHSSAQSVSPKPRPSSNPTADPVVPSPRPPPVRTTSQAPPTESPTSTAPAPITTTTTVRTFSDNVLTIGPGSTKTESSKTRAPSATGNPYGVIPPGDQNGGLMLTISLAVVFSVLAGLGLVVFCLFRRRSAKRRMHIFGKNHSHDLLEVLGQSHNSKNAGAGDQSLRRLSSNDAAFQEMSEQSRNSVRLSRRSSSQSLGQGGSGHQSMHMLSPRLSTARPQSSGHWSGSSGPRGNNASDSIIIGSGEYVAGPLESSGEFRNSQYDDYSSYGGLPQPPRPLYPGPGGGSSSYNSNEQLLLHQQQQQQHPFQQPGSYSSADLSRRSSLSAGVHPLPPHPHSEPIHLQSPLLRAKTLQTGSYPGSSSESLAGPPPQRASGTPSRTPSADSGSSLPPHMAHAHLQDLSRPRSMPMLNNMGLATPSHPPRHTSASMGGHPGAAVEHVLPERPYSMMPLNNSASNLVIPPSITTRPRSVMTPQLMHPGQQQQQQPSMPGSAHHYQQQQQQSSYYGESPYPLQNYSNSNNTHHNSYFPPPPLNNTNNNEPSMMAKRGSGPIVVVAPSPARGSVVDQGTTPAPAAAAPISGAGSEP